VVTAVAMAGPAPTLAELARLVSGQVQGDGSVRLSGVHTLDLAGPEHIAFFNHASYAEQFERSRAGAVIVEPGTAKKHPKRTLLIVPNASLAFARISRHFHPQSAPQPGVAREAFVHPEAQVDPSARIEPLAYVGARARIGPRAWVQALAYVGEGASIGEDCRLGPQTVVAHGCVLGARVILQPGAVIGADGFGYALDLEEGQHLKIPQVGTVTIEDDVEVGANACVDRSTMGTTRIGRGSKLDNLVQVGHNVSVGEMCILCGQVGIAGSSKLGDGVVLGGQVGIANHLHVGDGAKIAAQSGLGDDVPAGQIWAGSPAMPHRRWLRAQQVYSELGDLAAEVRKLRAELEALKSNSDSKSNAKPG
jgi:UDP-3-O-[3-hydroxymyristoyl] glucosamine N-acyltransferase